MAFGANSGSFGRSGGSGGGAMQEIIAMIQDIKAAPALGQKRLVIREQGKVRSHAVIDIDMKHGRDIEEKGTYLFKVERKAEEHNGTARRKTNSGFKAYHCSEKPEEYTAERAHSEPFNRFGGGSNMKSKSRTKF